jgi:hypothetical protein
LSRVALSHGAKQAAEFILQKFGRRVPTQTVDEVAAAVSGVVAKYGDEAVPFLKASGHAGFDALEQAGDKAPEVIKLYLKRGDEAVWIISKPEKLAIFIKHGDTAAEALIKHPGIADSLIAQYGDDAAGALAKISRQSSRCLFNIGPLILCEGDRQREGFSKVLRKRVTPLCLRSIPGCDLRQSNHFHDRRRTLSERHVQTSSLQPHSALTTPQRPAIARP